MGYTAIIDYGVGNLKSVSNSLAYLGVDSEITGDPCRLELADAIILPGVGAFPDAADKLRESGLEQILLRQAGNKPILGICRGIQFLNAALGGTLYQDLPTEHPSEIGHSMKPPYDRMAHTVHIWPMTPLASLLGKTELEVNSCHHQAIRSLAPSLVEMARSTDDLIEAMYLPGKTFVWGVQWHPEMSLQEESSRKIFEAFVGAVQQK